MSLYHLTGAAGALSILRAGAFELSMADGLDVEEELSSGAPYFLSTMRTRNNAFANRNRDAEVFFILDERKIKSKYRTQAVDFWRSAKHYESEERILSRKRKIPLAHILSSISINAGVDEKSSTLRRVVIECLKKKIPITAYANKKDFLTQNKSRQIPLDTELLKKITKPAAKENVPPLLAQLRREEEVKNRRDVSAWLSLLHAAAYGRLGQLQKHKNADLKQLLKEVPMGGSFTRRGLQSDLDVRLSSAQVYGRGTRQMLYAQKFSDLMRQLGLNTGTVIQYIRDKMDEAAPISH